MLIQILQMSLITLFVLIAVGKTDIAFQATNYFHAQQIRLFPSSNSSLTLYQSPMPTHPDNLSSAALALSGYDIGPNNALNFRTELSINTNANNFQILLATINSTRIYSINFFLIAINKEASSWLHIQSNCFQTKVAPFNPQLLNYTEQQAFQGPMQFNSADRIVVVPYINSVYTQVYQVGNYLNFSQSAPKNNTMEFYLNIYRNYSYFMSACASFLIVKQSYIQAQQFSAYAYSQKLTMRPVLSAQTLQNYATNSFGVPFPYGPVLEPKCVLGFHAFLIDSTQRSNLNFDISQAGVTGLAASSTYLVDFSYFCLADIVCPNPGEQYYPLINECQMQCSIEHCLNCSSSTSCMKCNATYYVDPLSRCSKCLPNCLQCSNKVSCSACAVGYFYSANVCQMCSMYCLSCNLDACTQCADGYTPNGTRCISCQVVMPQCLRCINPAQCTQCRDTFAFNSNLRSCQSCSAMMPNCLRCDLPNNCLSCMPNYYKQSFSVCSACTFQVQACCPTYVGNCSICASNSTCKSCQIGFTLNSNKQCELCSLHFGQACASCDGNGCFSCLTGYFIGSAGCQTCNSSIDNCLSCNNATVCLRCKQSYIFAIGKCLQCLIWPLKSLYFIDQQRTCRQCQISQPFCSRCTIEGMCLSCIDTHFLNSSGKCQLCFSAIPLCVSCKDNLSCSHCQSSYFVNLSNPSQCLSCSNYISDCLECKMISSGSSNPANYKCLKCKPQYFASQITLQCTLCASAIKYCLECINSISCITCLNSYYLTPQGQCVDCTSILPGCVTCLSRSVCLVCQDGYVLQGSYCNQCTILLKNCRSCRRDGSGKPVCGSCVRGYYLTGNASCLSCRDRDQLCLQCNVNTCTSCLSSYYVSGSGQCKKCYQLIANCDYCTPDLVCRSCLPGFVYNAVDFSCKGCDNYVSGCLTCNFTIDRTNLNLNVSCLTCQKNYIFLRSQNDSSACFLCSSLILNCEQCLSANLCGKCQSLSFINPSGTCSRCQLYLPGCVECTSSSHCVTCSKDYTLNANNSCIQCNMTAFGVDKANQTLCVQCNAKLVPATCTKCTDKAYLVKSGSRCVLCQESIADCQSCLGASRCINCLPSYYLSLDGSSCKPCPFQNCAVCTSSSCLSCFETSFLSNNKCITCHQRTIGCQKCNSSSCSECNDGYYLKDASCISCQQIDSSCVICSTAGTCLVRDPNRVASGHSATAKTLGIISLSGLGVAIIGMLIVVGLLCRRRKYNQEAQESEPKTQTSRRMSQDQIYDKELQIKDSKLCHYCKGKSPQFMRVELLCNECEVIQTKGDKHKILKNLRKEYVDRIKEEEESQNKRVTLAEESIATEKSKENKRQYKKNIIREPQLGIESFVPVHPNYNKAEKEETIKIQSTKVASSQRSKRIRDMF